MNRGSQKAKNPFARGERKKLLGIYSFILPYKKYFIAGLVCLFFSSGILLLFPYLTGVMLDVATGNTTPLFSSIEQVVWTLLITLLLQVFFSFFKIYFFSLVNQNMLREIRSVIYKKYLSLSLSNYQKKSFGEWNSRITQDITLLESFSVTLSEIIRQFLILSAGSVILFMQSYRLTLFMLSIIPFVVIFAIFFGKYIKRLSRKTQDTLAESNVIVEETLLSLPIVKSFTNEFFEWSRYRKKLNRVMDISLRVARYRGFFVSFILFSLFGSISAILAYGGFLVSQGILSMGVLTTFVIYTLFIGGSIAGLGDMFTSLQKIIGATERILEIKNMPQEVELKATPPNHSPLKGDISFHRVFFSYPNEPEKQILCGVSFTIHKGEDVVIVGMNGAGKSTLVQLLLGFFSPQKGEIVIDGKKIDDYPLQNYRNSIGYISQETMLFGHSILENIRYGRLEASDEECVAVAKQSGSWSFIASFPKGIHTPIGGGGMKLSGGQKQKLSIARILLKNPDIVIFDEATNALDTQSESYIKKELKQLFKEKTTITITHKLSNIHTTDKIIVLDKGKIVDIGKHQELIEKRKGIYSILFE